VTGFSVALSVDISDEKTAKCTKRQTYASGEAGKFVAFNLTAVDPTTETVTDTVTETVTVGLTTLQISKQCHFPK